MLHPRLRNDGISVEIASPTQASDRDAWRNPGAILTVTPDGRVPNLLNKIRIESVRTRGEPIEGSPQLAEGDFREPAFKPAPGYKCGAGALVVEPDSRVWVVHPTNGFGGYQHTFPKGTAPDATKLRETAVREVFEESGLQVELIDFLVDSQRSTSTTRYFLARRVSGSPADMGWESQAVSLVPKEELMAFLDQQIDREIARALEARWGEWDTWFRDSPRPDPRKQVVADRWSWFAWPMSERRTSLQLNFSLNAQEAERVRQGLIPMEMEQHWFGYFENDTLHWIRSWTGFHIFSVSFVEENGGLRATHALASRDPEEYGDVSDEEDRGHIESLTRDLACLSPNGIFPFRRIDQ